MSGIIKDAAKQLNSTRVDPDDFKLIWFAAWGQSPDVQIDQFRSALYGECSVLVARPQESPQVIPCYYYTFSDFHRLPHVDGAIATSEYRAGFYLNAFSPRIDALKRARLFQMFERNGNVCDPNALEAAGKALVCDYDLDRRDKAAVYTHIVNKYGFRHGEFLPMPGEVVTARLS